MGRITINNNLKIKGKISLLSNVFNEQWYGIEINEANTSPDVTRVAGTGYMSYHATLPIHILIKGCILNDDGTVNYYLDPTNWDLKATGGASKLNGDDGQVMMEWQNFYYRVVYSTPTIYQIRISLNPIAGYTLVSKHYISAYESTTKSGATIYMASVKNNTVAYRGGNGTVAWDASDNTLLGMPRTNYNRTNGRIRARNRGTGWNLYGYNDHKWLFWLFAIEYATLNSQKAVDPTLTVEGYKKGGLGNGVTTVNTTEWNNFNAYNPFILCGASDSLLNGSGEVSVTKTNFGGIGVNRTFKVSRYRGHENPFGHIWKMCDGVNLKVSAGISELYTANNPADWNDSNYTNYSNKGSYSRSDGYMSIALIGDNAEFIAKVAAGALNTYYCDYFYQINTLGLYMLLVGGYAHYGPIAGFVYSSAHDAPSYAYASIGSRIRFSAA